MAGVAIGLGCLALSRLALQARWRRCERLARPSHVPMAQTRRRRSGKLLLRRKNARKV